LLARVRIRAAWVPRLAGPLEKDLVVPAARHKPPVIRAHLASYHACGLRPHRRPRMRGVVLLEERLPDRDANVLAEKDRRRTLPSRRREVGGEIRVSGVARRTGVDVHE